MGGGPTREELRDRLYSDMASAIAKWFPIEEDRFRRTYLIAPAPAILDFKREIASDETVFDEVFADLSEKTGLSVDMIRSKFSPAETFIQFGEHLLNARAYAKGGS